MAKEPLIHDLDKLRPPAEYVLLGGRKIDISFIPSGVALDVIQRKQELEAMTDTPEKLAEIEDGGPAAAATFELAAMMCATITAAQVPEMDKDWLLKNTSVNQLKALIDIFTTSVFASLEGVQDEDGETKKRKAVKPRP